MSSMNPIDKFAIQEPKHAEQCCAMNNLLTTVHQDQEVDSYQCPYCPNKPDNICKECIYICHRTAHGEKVFNEKDINTQLKVKLSQFECLCAANGHKVDIIQKLGEGEVEKEVEDFTIILKEFLTEIGCKPTEEFHALKLKGTPINTIVDYFTDWEKEWDAEKQKEREAEKEIEKEKRSQSEQKWEDRWEEKIPIEREIERERQGQREKEWEDKWEENKQKESLLENQKQRENILDDKWEEKWEEEMNLKKEEQKQKELDHKWEEKWEEKMKKNKDEEKRRHTQQEKQLEEKWEEGMNKKREIERTLEAERKGLGPINFNRIPCHLFSKKYFQLFFPTVISTIEALEKISHPDIYEPRKAKRSVSKQYDNEMTEMMKIFNIFKGNSIFFDRDYVNNIFNFHFMKKLFSVTKFTQRDDLLETKYQALRSFIDLHIKPLANQKFRKMLTMSIMNTSPVHRFTFRQPLSDYFKSIEVEQNDYLNLVTSIHDYLMSAYQFQDTVKDGSSKSTYHCIFFQYLRLIKYMFSYDMTAEAEIIQKYINQILEINLYNMKRINNLRELQKIIPIVINDIKCSENDKRDKIQLFFENSPLNTNFIKQFFSNYTYNEAEQSNQMEENNEDENNAPYEPQGLYDTADNRAVDTDVLDIKGVEGLEFGDRFLKKPKEINEVYQYSQNNYIYDILFTKNDLYIDSLLSLLEATKNYIVDDLRDIAKDNDKTDTMKTLFSDNESYFKTKEFIKDHTQLKMNVYNGRDLHSDIMTEITSYLKNIGENLGNSLNLCNITKKNLKQIWLTRNGLFSNLLEVLSFVQTENSKAVYQGKIYNTLLELISKLVEDNAFLCSVLFNEKMLRVLPLNTCVKFYVGLLKILKNDKYKINLFQFIEFNKSFLSDNDQYSKLEIYHLLLKVSSKKSIDAINYHIWSQFRNNKDFFKDEYSKYLSEMDHKVDYNAGNEVSNAILINKIILSMSLNYLYMIKTNVPLKIIGEILTKNPKEVSMPPEQRISFVKLYDKCFIRYPYKVRYQFDPRYLRHVDEQDMPKVEGENKEAYSVAKLNNYFVETPYNKPSTPDSLIINIQHFEDIYKKFEKDSFNKNPRFLLKYFLNVVLIPAMDYLYKITYFSQTVTYEVKFKIYEVIHIFIKSYKNLLEIIEKNKYIKDEYIMLFSSFFVNTTEKDKDLNLFLLTVVSKLDNHLKEFKKESIDYMDHIKMIEIFDKYAVTMKSNLVIEKRPDKVKQKMEYLKKANNFKTNYIKNKSKIESWSISTVVKTSRELESDYNIEQIKINLLALIFSYSKLNEVEDLDKPETVDKIVEPTSNYYIKLINKLIQQDPSFYQLEISKSKTIKRNGIYTLFKCRLLFFYQFIFIEFWNRSANNKDSFIDYFIRIIKFATYLCSKINVFYVNTLSSFVVYNSKEDSTSEEKVKDEDKLISLNAFTLKFMTYMIKAMEFQSKKTALISNITYFNEESKTNYFTRVIKRIFALHREFLHCNADNIYNPEAVSTLAERLTNDKTAKESGYLEHLNMAKEERTITSKEFKNLIRETNKILLNMTSSEIYSSLFIEYLEFIHCYCYQHDYDFDIDLKNILAIMYSLYEALYVEVFKPKPKEVITFINSHKKLIEQITKKEEILNKRNYKLLAKLYIIINYCSKSRKNGKFEKLLENMKNSSIIEDNKELNNNKNLMWQREIFLFLRNLIRTVEISINYKFIPDHEGEYDNFLIPSQDDKNNPVVQLVEFSKKETDILRDKTKSVWVFFQVRPEGIFIESNDVIRFWELAPYDQPHTKYEYLHDYFKYIDNLVHVRKQIITSHSKVLSILFQINYKYVEYYSLFMSILINVLIVCSISYSRAGLVDPLHNIIFYFSLLHIMVLFIFLVTLTRVELFKFKSLNKQLEKKSESVESKIEIREYITKHLPSTTFLLVWNFVIGLMAITNPRMNFLYSLQLFSFFYFIETMNAVLKSVSLKYKEFLSAGLLILIFILFYAIVSVIFFQDQFENADLNENICDTLLHCFVSLINYGVRTGSGFGFSIKSSNDSHYWSQFIFDWIFYFTIMLVMLNIINGIIVDTFQSQREENKTLKEEKENTCFICSYDKPKFEANGLNFKNHCLYEHNILDYLQFMLRVMKNEHNEDQILAEQYVFSKMTEGSTDFFPVRKTLVFNQ